MTALILMAAVAVAVWGTVVVLRMPLLLACLATVIIASCFGYFFFRFDVGPVTVTLDRLVYPLLVVTYVVRRHFGRTQPKPLTAREWLLAAFVVWITASTYTHDYRTPFLSTAPPTWRLFTAYVVPALLYWIALQSPIGERDVARVHTALIVYGLYLAAMGVLETLQMWAFVFPKTMTDPEAGIHFGRARGPMLSAVSFGLHLGIGLLCLWSARDRLPRIARPALVALLPLYAASVYFTYTRSSWLGVALGLFVVLALTLRGRLRVLVLGSTVAAGILTVAMKSDRLMAFEREQSAADTQASATMRLSFAHVSWKMFLDRPIFGFGFGQFPREKLAYLSDRSVDLPLEAIRPLVHHNTILSLLVETGALGMGLFCAVLLSWGWHALRVYHDPETPPWARRHAVLLLGVLPLYVCQIVFHELSYSTLDNGLVFTLAGTAAALRPPAKSAAAAVCRAAAPRPFTARAPQLGFE